MDKNPIVIMAAMEIEADFLLKNLDSKKEVNIGKYTYYEGTINEYPIVVCRCHVMTNNAAIATYIAIERYNPIAIISQGTAGAHSKNLHTGDIIIGEKCINIVSTKTPYKNEGEGSNSLEWKLRSFFSQEDERREIQTGNDSLLKIAKQIYNEHGKVHFGILGSGDVWNCEKDKIIYLNSKYDTLCEDMESIAIYTVANDFNIPVLGIRVISNNELLGESYDRKVSLYAQQFVYNLIIKVTEEKILI